jgi:hypothetical protein
LNGIEHGCLNIQNTLTRGSKTTRHILSSPLQLRRDLANRDR